MRIKSLSDPRLKRKSSEVSLTSKAGKKTVLRDTNWPRLFLLTSCPSFTPTSPLSKTKRALESFGQMVGRTPLHPAMDGESRPFPDPQTKTKEAHPRRSLWTTPTARHYGQSAKERTRSSLIKKTRMDCRGEHKAKEI